MKKKRYDLILGLGSVCSCTQTLRQAGLQHLTFPFDWITSYTKHYDVDVSRRTDQICNEFADSFPVVRLKYRRRIDRPRQS